MSISVASPPSHCKSALQNENASFGDLKVGQYRRTRRGEPGHRLEVRIGGRRNNADIVERQRTENRQNEPDQDRQRKSFTLTRAARAAARGNDERTAGKTK